MLCFLFSGLGQGCHSGTCCYVGAFFCSCWYFWGLWSHAHSHETKEGRGWVVWTICSVLTTFSRGLMSVPAHRIGDLTYRGHLTRIRPVWVVVNIHGFISRTPSNVYRICSNTDYKPSTLKMTYTEDENKLKLVKKEKTKQKNNHGLFIASLHVIQEGIMKEALLSSSIQT